MVREIESLNIKDVKNRSRVTDRAYLSGNENFTRRDEEELDYLPPDNGRRGIVVEVPVQNA